MKRKRATTLDMVGASATGTATTEDGTTAILGALNKILAEVSRNNDLMGRVLEYTCALPCFFCTQRANLTDPTTDIDMLSIILQIILVNCFIVFIRRVVLPKKTKRKPMMAAPPGKHQPRRVVNVQKKEKATGSKKQTTFLLKPELGITGPFIYREVLVAPIYKSTPYVRTSGNKLRRCTNIQINTIRQSKWKQA